MPIRLMPDEENKDYNESAKYDPDDDFMISFKPLVSGFMCGNDFFNLRYLVR